MHDIQDAAECFLDDQLHRLLFHPVHSMTRPHARARALSKETFGLVRTAGMGLAERLGWVIFVYGQKLFCSLGLPEQCGKPLTLFRSASALVWMEALCRLGVGLMVAGIGHVDCRLHGDAPDTNQGEKGCQRA